MTTETTNAAAPAPAAAAAAPATSAQNALFDAPAGDPAAAAAPAGDPAAPAAGDPKPAEGEAPAALTMPGKGATPEEWSAFYNAIGRPEAPDGYELPVPDGQDPEFAAQMAPILHKNGLTAEQAKGLANDWNAMMAAQQAEASKAEATRLAALDSKNKAEAAELTNEWGPKATENMEMAKRAVRQFMPGDKAAETIAAIENVLGYKETIKFLHGVGKGLGESDAAGLGDVGAGAQKSLADRLYGNS